LQSVYNYQRVIIDAFTEVINRVSKVENFGKGIEIKKQQVESLKVSVAVASNLFQFARVNFRLDARRFKSFRARNRRPDPRKTLVGESGSDGVWGIGRSRTQVNTHAWRRNHLPGGKLAGIIADRRFDPRLSNHPILISATGEHRSE
jgi:hypothetical protein